MTFDPYERVVCRHCRTAIKRAALAQHEKKCAEATVEARSFYAAHRCWPERGQTTKRSGSARH